ncbi:hypothetical protein LPJ59_004823 [Coemansia sp. RSA 2399]|nr:hypothetical protein LPJ59_004823 [Coemansia sp. RSA 2399]
MPPKRPRNLRKTKGNLADWNDNEETPNVSSEPTAAPLGAGQIDTGKQPSLQTASTSGPSSGSTATEGAAGGVSLDDLREFQKYRRHNQRGVDVDALARGERKKRQPKSGPSWNGSDRRTRDGGDGGVEDRDEGGDGAVARSLSGAFTVQTNKLDANKHMMSYIEKEMEKHRGAGLGVHVKDHETADGSSSQQALKVSSNNNGDNDNGNDDGDPYRVPNHLRVIDKKPSSEGNVAMAAKMLTSIQEVDLGAASRAKNIRETDRLVSRAKRMAQAGGEQDRESSAGTNTYAPPMHNSGGSRFRTHTDLSERSSKATDDIALQRFKKRMRR